MAFTPAEKLFILKWLGYPIVGHGELIDQACSQVSNMGSEYEAEVKKTLRELADVQKDIDDARLGAGRSFQSSAQGTAQYYRGERLNELRQAGRQHANFLAQMMSMNIYRDVFSASNGSSGRSVRG